MEGLVIKKVNGEIIVTVNGKDITNQIININVYEENGTFYARLDMPLNEVNITQDIKIM